MLAQDGLTGDPGLALALFKRAAELGEPRGYVAAAILRDARPQSFLVVGSASGGKWPPSPTPDRNRQAQWHRSTSMAHRYPHAQFSFSGWVHRQRILVEGSINRIKNVRGLATRYERRPDKLPRHPQDRRDIRIWLAA